MGRTLAVDVSGRQQRMPGLGLSARHINDVGNIRDSRMHLSGLFRESFTSGARHYRRTKHHAHQWQSDFSHGSLKSACHPIISINSQHASQVPESAAPREDLLWKTNITGSKDRCREHDARQADLSGWSCRCWGRRYPASSPEPSPDRIGALLHRRVHYSVVSCLFLKSWRRRFKMAEWAPAGERFDERGTRMSWAICPDWGFSEY